MTKHIHTSKVAVVGLGYVGLPLALLSEVKGFNTIGIDLDQAKLTKLKTKQSVIDDQEATKRLQKSAIAFTDDFSKVSDRNIVIICVPTPVNKNKQPDISLVKNAVISCVKNMKSGSLLVVESTINPGVCDEIVIPAIEANSDHKVGKTLHLAHCPERINPGDPKWTVDNINRVVGADSEKGLTIAYEFYSHLVDAKIKKMASLKEAEAVKIVENTFRDVNIAFVNELAMSFNKLGINVNNVIDGAATKPFAFMPHYPGIGIGGHCIPVDPYYLIEYARGQGFEHEFLSLARSINESMPLYVVNQVEQTLLEQTKSGLKGAKVGILGLSYKPNVGDDRESPAYDVIRALEQRGAIVSSYDPYIKHRTSLATTDDLLKDRDAVILVTAHTSFNKIIINKRSELRVFYDGRNFFKDRRKKFQELDIKYIGISN